MAQYNMQILVTGAAGFIGADLIQKLLSHKHTVVGVDNCNDYYDVNLKRDRLTEIDKHAHSDLFHFEKFDIVDREKLEALFSATQFDVVVHLAAQAGVRHSLDHPYEYVDSNLVGFANVLENCRQHTVPHFIYASSSSVYGMNENFPFSEQDRVDAPVSLYAATKRSNELMAHSYAHLYDMRCTGLRFFTVYGPWGRPDMAPFRFASRMLKGQAIPVYNNGDMLRDFTYIDDINECVCEIVQSQQNHGNYKIYNIGRGEPVRLLDFIESMAKHFEVAPNLKMLPMQPGDVVRTMAETSLLEEEFAYQPKVSIDQGMELFARLHKGI